MSVGRRVGSSDAASGTRQHNVGLVALLMVSAALPAACTRDAGLAPRRQPSTPPQALVATPSAPKPNTGAPAQTAPTVASPIASSVVPAPAPPAVPPSAPDTRPQDLTGLGAARLELQGYVGKHPIRAILSVDTGAKPGSTADAWTGVYRYLGKNKDIKLKGQRNVAVDENGDIAPDVTTLSGEPSPTFACDFEESVGGKVTGSVEATCDTSNGLVVEGSWSAPSAASTQPFFLGPIGSDGAFDIYYRAVLKTPGPAHRCAPYVRIGRDVPAARGRSLLSYVLSWPCENTAVGFIAQVDPENPERLLGAPLPFGALDRETTFAIAALQGGLGDSQIYEVTASNEQAAGPDSARCCWSSSNTRRWLLPMSADNEFGRAIELPPTISASGLGSCMNQSAQVEFAALDIAGDARPELIVAINEQAEEMKPAPQGVVTLGGVVCEPASPKISHRAYSLDPRNMSLVPISLPAVAARQKALQNARPLTRTY